MGDIRIGQGGSSEKVLAFLLQPQNQCGKKEYLLSPNIHADSAKKFYSFRLDIIMEQQPNYFNFFLNMYEKDRPLIQSECILFPPCSQDLNFSILLK